MSLMNLTTPRQSFFRFYNIVQLTSFFTYVLLGVIGSIIALTQTRWGYQTFISSIEAILILLLICILTIVEWICGVKMRKDNQYKHLGLKPEEE